MWTTRAYARKDVTKMSSVSTQCVRTAIYTTRNCFETESLPAIQSSSHYLQLFRNFAIAVPVRSQRSSKNSMASVYQDSLSSKTVELRALAPCWEDFACHSIDSVLHVSGTMLMCGSNRPNAGYSIEICTTRQAYNPSICLCNVLFLSHHL